MWTNEPFQQEGPWGHAPRFSLHHSAPAHTEVGQSFIVTDSQSSRLTCTSGRSQWGAADAEIKVPSEENTELKGSPFKAWSRSVYSQACYAFCQGFLSHLFLPFQSIHLHFFQNLSRFFPVLALANTCLLYTSPSPRDLGQSRMPSSA